MYPATSAFSGRRPTIPGYYLYGADATTARLRGLVGNPTNDGDGWNMEEWVIE